MSLDIKCRTWQGREHQALVKSQLQSMLNQSRCLAVEAFTEEASTSSSMSSDVMPGSAESPKRRAKIQTFDFSLLAACVSELQGQWIPSKIDQAHPLPQTPTTLWHLRSLIHYLLQANAKNPCQFRPSDLSSTANGLASWPKLLERGQSYAIDLCCRRMAGKVSSFMSEMGGLPF